MNIFELKINIKNNGGTIKTIRESFQADDLESLIEDLRYDFAEDYKTIEVKIINKSPCIIF